jgi:tetratricopeptide (TPR) repeat protein
MGIDYQAHRASVDTSKGFRQFQKADNALSNGNVDSAVTHLNKGYNYFATAVDHLAKAEEDAYNKAGKEIDQGNNDLQKSIDAYSNGNLDSAQAHYDKALAKYDDALDLMG